MIKKKKKKKIKKAHGHGVCEANLGWNFDKRQNKKIIEYLLKWVFLRYSLKFSENFEIESLLGCS